MFSKPLTETILKDIIMKHEKEDTSVVPLCVAALELDVFRIYSPCTSFMKVQPCVHPMHVSVSFTRPKAIYKQAELDGNPVTDSLLRSIDTSIIVEVKIALPFIIEEIKTKKGASKGTYRRLLLVLKNKTLARSILRQVLAHNQNYLGSTVLIPNHYKTLNDGHLKDVMNVITGFVIDFGENFIMYFEGLEKGFIENLCYQISMLNKIAAKIFFDSELLFNKRVYTDLIPYGAVYVVTIQSSLKFVSINKDMFLDGVHSEDCRKVRRILLTL